MTTFGQTYWLIKVVGENLTKVDLILSGTLVHENQAAKSKCASNRNCRCIAKWLRLQLISGRYANLNLTLRPLDSWERSTKLQHYFTAMKVNLHCDAS